MKKSKTIVIMISTILMILIVSSLFALKRTYTYNLDEKLELGQRYLENINYEQAIAIFEEVIEIDPTCVKAYWGLAESYMEIGDSESVVEALEYAIQVDPMNAKSYVLLADAYFDLENYDEAIIILKQGYKITKDPSVVLKMAEMLYVEDSNKGKEMTELANRRENEKVKVSHQIAEKYEVAMSEKWKKDTDKEEKQKTQIEQLQNNSDRQNGNIEVGNMNEEQLSDGNYRIVVNKSVKIIAMEESEVTYFNYNAYGGYESEYKKILKPEEFIYITNVLDISIKGKMYFENKSDQYSYEKLDKSISYGETLYKGDEITIRNISEDDTNINYVYVNYSATDDAIANVVQIDYFDNLEQDSFIVSGNTICALGIVNNKTEIEIFVEEGIVNLYIPYEEQNKIQFIR